MPTPQAVIVPTIFVLLLSVLAVQSPAAAGPHVHQVPSSIAADCSVDTTDALLDWIASVPDHSTLRFPSDACYRVDGSLRIEDRWGLTFDGNGATFQAKTDGDRDRRHFWFFGGGDLTIQDLTVIGANPEGGTSEPAYRADRAFQHAFALQGVRGARLQRVEAYDVYGDFVYLAPDGAGHRTAVHGWSQDIEVVDSTFARNGRQGIATVAARDVLIARNDIRDVRRAIFNLEPTGTSWGAERVTIEDNVTGRSRLLWLSSGGQGSNVRDLVVRNNTMEERTGTPVIHIVAPEGEQRGPVTIENNHLIVGGSPAPGMRLSRVRDVTITGNHATFPERRDMTAVRLQEVERAALHSNTFIGHAEELQAIDSTEVVQGAPGDTTPTDPAPGVRYLDLDPSSTHGPAVTRLSASGIVTGCATDRYCPSEALTRGELSSFLAAALGLELGSTSSGFLDVPRDHPDAAAITALNATGTLQGYTSGRFGPEDPLSRAQLATVLVSGFDVPRSAEAPPFDDVRAGSTHATSIATAAAHGITSGCGDGSTYCGGRSVTRGQIATFLDRLVTR